MNNLPARIADQFEASTGSLFAGKPPDEEDVLLYGSHTEPVT
ncbi:hypothetical protein PV646_21470 [Streptomyces sp. ID05-26A]|nr:hypothetical protein [Streptomyces sp. ID05-26A]